MRKVVTFRTQLRLFGRGKVKSFNILTPLWLAKSKTNLLHFQIIKITKKRFFVCKRLYFALFLKLCIKKIICAESDHFPHSIELISVLEGIPNQNLTSTQPCKRINPHIVKSIRGNSSCPNIMNPNIPSYVITSITHQKI